MAMTAGCAAIAACHAWFRAAALHARALLLKLIRGHRYYCCSGSSSYGGPSSPSTTMSCPPVLAALVCAAAAAAAFFPRAVAFFLPLVASTSAFCATAYLSVAMDPERDAGKEVVLVRRGEGGEAGTLQVYADANASAYAYDGGDKSSTSISSCSGFPVGCFLRKSAKRGVDEDGEEVVFAGRLLVPALSDGTSSASALEDELVSLQVDRMAERVWDSYFGRWTTWNHYAGDDGCDA